MTFTITAAGLATGAFVFLGLAVVLALAGKVFDREERPPTDSVAQWLYGFAVVLGLAAVLLAFLVTGIVQWGTP